MKTETLLNIRPELPKGDENNARQVLLQDPGNSAEADNFKSALMQQIGQHKGEHSKTDEKSVISLPQDGKALPNKENNDESIEQLIDKAKSELTDLPEEARAKRPLLLKGLPEQARVERPEIPEQTRVERPELPEEARAERPLLLKELPEQTRVERPEQLREEISVDPIQVKNENIIEPSLIAQEVSKTVSPVVLAQVFNDRLQATQIRANEFAADKRKSIETSNTQVGFGQSVNSRPVNAEAGVQTGSGSESKNDQALGKHIADFQQYMESSRKHAQPGETMTKVKTFDENLKVTQENIQSLRNESRVLANNIQNAQINQSAMQSMVAERTQMSAGFTPLSSFQPNTQATMGQTLASMEVKTTVGTSAWNQGFSNQITMMAKNGIQQARIKLNPAHLGPIEAMVKITGEAAVVNLSSLQLTTKDALENAVPRLKEMLNENGFSQVDVNVSHQDKKEQQGAALGSNNEHGHPTMPGEEQLSNETQEIESEAMADDSHGQGLNIVDYYA